MRHRIASCVLPHNRPKGGVIEMASSAAFKEQSTSHFGNQEAGKLQRVLGNHSTFRALQCEMLEMLTT
jgi:hypothetical protein